jgi:DNA repair exonuclease SbcCD ATPase subunit
MVVMNKKLKLVSVLVFISALQGCALLDNIANLKPDEKNRQLLDLDAIVNADTLIFQHKKLSRLKGKEKKQACDYLNQEYSKHRSWKAGWLMALDASKQDNCLRKADRTQFLTELQKRSKWSESLTWLGQRLLQEQQLLSQADNKAKALSRKLKKTQQQHDELKQQNTLLEQQIQELKAIEKTINKRIGGEVDSPADN